MDSSITVSKSGAATSFVGPDATELFRAVVLKSGIGLLQKGIQPTRGLTLTKALAMVERYTGKKYKRTQSDQAIADLVVWIETMKSAIPVIRN